MNKHKLRVDQRGEMNALLIPVILLGFFFVVTSGFSIWAFASRQDYKTNTDQKIAAAVQKANDETKAAKDVEFLERDKKPTKEYRGPDAYGRVSVSYPKTWSVYADEGGTASSVPVNIYMHPEKVPAINTKAVYALRIEVVNDSYDTQVAGFDANVKQGILKSAPYRAALVPEQLGVRLDGQISPTVTGTVILFPIRDKTLRVYTESQDLAKDFNEIVLPSLKFVP